MTVTLPLGIPEDLLRPPPPPPTTPSSAKKSRSKKSTTSNNIAAASITSSRQLVLPFNNSTKIAVTPLTAPLDTTCQRGLNDWLSFGRVPSDVPHGLALAAEAVRKAKRVVVISGAGISTHAIPDFRSSSGLFKEIAAQAKAEAKAGGKGSKVRRRKGGQLEDESSGRSTPVADMSGIKSGKDLFDVKCFTCPDMLAHHHNLLNRLTELSHSAEPSSFHRLLKTLDNDGRLMRCYTQNIDGLEGKAGLDCRVPEAKDWNKGSSSSSANNKRRKLNQSQQQQQQQASSSPEEPTLDAFPSSSQSSSVSGVSDLLDPTSSPIPTSPAPTTRSLPTCIPLHGLLESLDCTRCDYREPMSRDRPLPDEAIPCPKCVQDAELRVATSARPRSIGFLRASVILYGEEHKHGEAIGAVVERDLIGRTKDSRVDLLIVAGTTLQIPGVKRIIKEFARVLKSKPSATSKRGGGVNGSSSDNDDDDSSNNLDDEDREVDVSEMPIRTMLLNRDPPSRGKAGEWADVFDVWVQGDLQQFVEQWVTEGPDPAEMRPSPALSSSNSSSSSTGAKSGSVSPRKRKSPAASAIVKDAPISPAAKRTKITVKLAGESTAFSIGRDVNPRTAKSGANKTKRTVTKLTPSQPLITKAFVASKSGKVAAVTEEKISKLPTTPRKRRQEAAAARKENLEQQDDIAESLPMAPNTPKRIIKRSAKAQSTPKRNPVATTAARPLAKSTQPFAKANSAKLADWSSSNNVASQDTTVTGEIDRLSVSSGLQGDGASFKDISEDEREQQFAVVIRTTTRRMKPRANSTSSSELSDVPDEDEEEEEIPVLRAASAAGGAILRRSTRIWTSVA